MKCKSCVSSLVWNVSKAHLYILNFGKATEMSTEGKRLRYTEFIIVLRIPKGTVDMNSYWFCFLIFNSKFELRIPLAFRVSEFQRLSEKGAKEINMLHSELTTTLLMLKGTVNMN